MDTIQIREIGPALRLISLQILARDFKTTTENVEKFLEAIEVPWVEWFDGEKYVSQFSLEQAMFALSRCGEENWQMIAARRPPKMGRLCKWEFGLASLAYGGAEREVLKRRLEKVAKTFRWGNRRKKGRKPLTK